MNDAAVRDIWKRLEALERHVNYLSEQLAIVEARARARLKEEAEARERWVKTNSQHDLR